MNRAVFWDRDGIINTVKLKDGKPFPPITSEELEFCYGINEILQLTRQNGFLNIVVTNQPDIARKKIQFNQLVLMERKIRELPLDDVFTCIHDDSDDCVCRKPKPGMIQMASKKYNIDIGQSFMVGDRWRDIESGNKAGCKTIFVDYNYNEKRPTTYDFSVTSLQDVANIIINNSRSSNETSK